MSLRIDIGWLLATMLVSVRVAAATMLTPVLGPAQIPAMVRVLLALVLGAMLVAALPVQPVEIYSTTDLMLATFGELVIGASLSFGFMAAYAATQLAGRVLDVQIGFGVASVISPATQSFAPLLGTVFGMAAVAVFLALDGHHVLIKALTLSMQGAPPGAVVHGLNWEAIFEQSKLIFTFGLALAAPVMLALLLADLSMAVLARSMPLLNVFVLSFSVKIVLGLIALAASVKFAEPLLAALFEDTYTYWERAVTP